MRRLLERHSCVWVNTIGTRRPRLSSHDAAKVARRLRQWLRPNPTPCAAAANLTVITPPMWPGFGRGWQRRLNRRSIERALRRAPAAGGGERRVAVSTLPIAGPLIGALEVDAWVYYCVDDFSSWPGADAGLVERMERRLVRRAARVVAASAVLQERVAALGGCAALLTHGVDLAHWSAGRDESVVPAWVGELKRPLILLWGLIDRRLDAAWLRRLQEPARGAGGSLILIGPEQSPDPFLRALPATYLAGPVPYDDLPAWAARADVLIMPYADQPFTRAMQPLKLKEYLATGKPAVVRDLPATREWADAADLAATEEEFVRAVAVRAAQGLPPDQHAARRRLAGESWEEKARRFEAVLFDAL